MKTLTQYICERVTSIVPSQIIVEGGAYGHMQHIFDNGDLTFRDVKEILTSCFDGHIKMYEKMDGQELSVTVKDGDVMAARNKTSLDKPMPLDDFKAFLAETDKNGNTKRSMEMLENFTRCFLAIRKALLSLSKEEQEKFFANGKNYISLELINPQTRNVIDYGNKLMLCIHGISKYDDKWNLTNINKDASMEIIRALEARNVTVVDDFELKGSEVLKLKALKDNDDVLKNALSQLDKIRGNASEDTRIEDWTRERYLAFTRKHFGEKLSENICQALVLQYSPWSSQKVGANEIKKMSKAEGWDVKSEEFTSWFNVKELDKLYKKESTKIIEPLEDLIMTVGVELLERVEGFLTVDPDKTSQKLRKELEDEIAICKDKSADDEDKRFKLEKNMQKLAKYQDHLMQAAEGLVFMYKDQMYKMTGQFGAINQILGLYRYSR